MNINHMQKIIIFLIIVLLSAISAVAQDTRTEQGRSGKVAVLEPAGDLGAGMRGVVRDEIRSVVANATGFQLVDQNHDWVLATNVASAGTNFSVSMRLTDARTSSDVNIE